MKQITPYALALTVALQPWLAHGQTDSATPVAPAQPAAPAAPTDTAAAPTDTAAPAPPTAPAPAPAAAAPKAPATSGSAQKCDDNSLGNCRLDLAVPTIPAFTALGVSPTSVSRPGTIRDFVAALANGIDKSGHVQSGLAIEASPYKILAETIKGLNSDAAQTWLSGLRISIATNGTTATTPATGALPATTVNKTELATGVRWSYTDYQPETDLELKSCLDPALDAALGRVFGPALEPGQKIPGPIGAPVADMPGVSVAPEIKDSDITNCRGAARAAHLAQTGVELAGVHVTDTTGDTTLKSFHQEFDSLWVSLALGINSYDPRPQTATQPALERAQKKNWQGAFGFEPLLFARLDSKVVDSVSSREKDFFAALRLPFISDGWSIFLEGGYKRPDLGKVLATTPQAQLPLALGGDIRLASGTWLGLYAGADARNGDIFSLGNIKWAMGENRPYSSE